MTRKDYVLIAAAIKEMMERAQMLPESHREIAVGALTETARVLGAAFTVENPRFDRARFLAACGVES